MKEEIFANHIAHKRLISRIYTEFTQQQKTQLQNKQRT